MAVGELLDFECADKTLPRLGIGVVVQLDVGCKARCEFLVGVGLEAAAVVRVNGGVGEAVSAHDGVDIQACPATHDGLPPAGGDALVGGLEIIQKAVGVVLFRRVADVDKVVGDVGAVEVVVPRSMPRNTCRESALIISPPMR